MKKRKEAPEGWPDAAPVLTGAHITRGTWDDECGKRDLTGWLENTFTGPSLNKAYDCLLAVVCEKSGIAVEALWVACDDEQFKKGFLAKCWNQAMSRLGFEIPEEFL